MDKFLERLVKFLKLDKTDRDPAETSDGGAERASDDGGKRPVNKLIVFLIIASIAALAFPHFFQSGGSGDSGSEDPQTPTQYSEVEEYVRKTERDLKEILERIQGAGEVSVRIYVENDGEKALAKDSRTTSRNSSSDGGGAETQNESETEESVVMSGQGSSQEPIVLSQTAPTPTGILVVAEGAADENVKYEIYEAVRALYGIPSNRIKITH